MGKYFKYVIGEILLVVIGILIALQINNWNEGRKTNLQAKNYKKTIVNDLVQDTLAINSLIKRTKIYKKNITNYFSYIDSLQPSSSNLKKLSDSLSNVTFLYMKYYPVNNSYKQMGTSGKGELLAKKQRDFLMDLLSDQEEIGIIIDNQLQVAVRNKDKADEFSGLPYNIYEKLNARNSKQKQIQSIIHLNLWLKAVDDLYFYIEIRGEKVKKKIQDNIHLFIENP
ncbi:MAG: hypothetical protein JXQ93_02875 [Flavobacteriaceae bacterium]